MYKMPANAEQSMAVFFLCILLAVVMVIGFMAYFIWKNYCQKANRKTSETPSINQTTRHNSHSMSTTVNIVTPTEQCDQVTVNSEDDEEEVDEDESDAQDATTTSMYTFPNEGSRCFRPLKTTCYRQGELFAHPSSYRQNLSLVGRNLHTVEEVEEGLDSPPSYEELFPAATCSTILSDDDEATTIYFHQNGSADKRDS